MASTAHTKSIYKILPAGPEDAEQVAAVGNKAFCTSSLYQAMFPKEKAHLTPPEELRNWRTQRRAAFMRNERHLGFKAVLTDQPDVIIGYVGWMKPGHFTKKEGLGSLVNGQAESGPDSEASPSEPPACMNAGIKQGLEAELDRKRAEIWRDDPNFWYLAACGVDPDYQRQGIAGALLREGLEQADAQGLPAYLESTPEGAFLYPRFGFETLEVMEMLDGRYRTSIMIRRPKTSQC
ncbi:hypothetical protein KC332_g15082 [Hortaea werneckii]|uniref:N-acetyltransferase domain-containing protein n=2 Tax=Hortaea werneckii TaxID=91943 RepID=A0A3M7IJR9_HORWE|nr:hypothetical protein KC358_g15820 [Hortaea werneckii]OTA22110.1 hypothetical protein BTJ68_14616 [Hortaea werneckii EXF-2000]KAI6926805.1 hypothetical protein KC341_g12554 [Hortaea werneckii]KAI6950552.1 hypothetical protein KC348_g591 [Hortaea werneckii]KAI6965568.1 hypothetical protein KC329_g15187 [Hortaea werneckii]